MNYPYVSDPNIQRALRTYFPDSAAKKKSDAPKKTNNKKQLKVRPNG
jgi:hypothetical protein